MLCLNLSSLFANGEQRALVGVATLPRVATGNTELESLGLSNVNIAGLDGISNIDATSSSLDLEEKKLLKLNNEKRNHVSVKRLFKRIKIISKKTKK